MRLIIASQGLVLRPFSDRTNLFRQIDDAHTSSPPSEGPTSRSIHRPPTFSQNRIGFVLTQPWLISEACIYQQCRLVQWNKMRIDERVLGPRIVAVRDPAIPECRGCFGFAPDCLPPVVPFTVYYRVICRIPRY